MKDFKVLDADDNNNNKNTSSPSSPSSFNNNNNNITSSPSCSNNNDDEEHNTQKFKSKVARISSKQPTESTLGYTETLMHGHYSTTRLRRMLRQEKSKLRRELSEVSQHSFHKESNTKRFTRFCCDLINHRNIQDWSFLTLLGISVAIFSFLIDLFIENSLIAHRWLYRIASGTYIGQYLAWVIYPLVLISFSTGFTRLVSPTAIGSGIPEVKTIMKGVVLKEYLTFKTLVAKVVGLTASLGSGLPLGKVGPFVHVASITASNLSRLFSIFKHVRENEALQIDILTAASAVGVSCTFAAPIGGVLFSVEATATYFAVRNYWRGFYSAMCGAFTFRLLSSLTKSEETLTALFKTELRQTLPFDIFEIVAFALVGVICGVLGAGFVWLHKSIVLFVRGHKQLNDFLQKSRFIYPCIVTLVIFSVTFPEGIGKYMAGELTLREAVNQFFDNRTWLTDEPETVEEQKMLAVWRGPLDNALITIGLFFLMKFWMCAIATTLPVPCGIFIPAFALGSAVGRFFGELMAYWCPDGIRDKKILPGAYSLVGAATFSGAVTHTVSPAVIVFELTGHLGHLLPCVMAVMVAGATASFLQSSVYDTMIEIKKLPFLPSRIDPETCNAHNIKAEDIMVREVQCLSDDSTYGDVWKLISEFKHRAYPFILSKDSQKFIGSILRTDLKYMLFKHFAYTTFSFDNQLSPSLPLDNKAAVTEKQLPSSFVLNEIIPLEDQLLDEPADFHMCDIDPAPFQIPSKTSLYRIHWLFSLLSLHHAFVTEEGRIVGVLSLAEVRRAIQCEVNSSTNK